MNADELYLCKQVVSLKLSQRLHGMGVPQRSLFVWEKEEGNKWYPALDTISTDRSKEYSSRMHSAFMASELGAILPSCISVHKQRNGGHWICTLQCEDVMLREEDRQVCATTMPDALAKMLIRLIETGRLQLPRMQQIEAAL